MGAVNILRHTRWSNISSFIIIFFIFIPHNYAETKSVEPPAIGNFALPYSQQPGAFLSFGQNTLDKGKTQLYIFADDYAGNQQHYIDAIPGIVYGLTDNLSLFFNVPYAVSYQQESHHSSGLKDIFIQLEYTFYSKETHCYADTSTIVFNTSFPTGSSKKDPPTGFGAQAYFLGGTFSRLYSDWLGFFSPGILAATSHHGTKFGNNFLYQLGVGKNISYQTSHYILSWLIELNGTYYQKNRIEGERDPNSGGNIIYVIPSLWYSTQHLILQPGVGWAVAQKWNGSQPKSTYILAINLGWTF